MLLAAEYYIEKENLFIVGEDQKIRLVGLWSTLFVGLCKDMFCQVNYTGLEETKKKPYNSNRAR